MPRNITVKKSSIHGRGVFAHRLIQRHDLIGKYVGRPTRRNGPHVLWITGEDDRIYGVDGTCSLKYLNHSARPNAKFYGDELYATSRIVPNEEITIHYGDDWDDE